MITTYFKNLIADNLWHTTKDASTNLPVNYYLALSRTEPLVSGAGVDEPNDAAAYKRQLLGTMQAASEGSTSNANGIAWSRFDTDQGQIGYWALYDAEEGGNLLMGGPLDSVKHIDPGTTIIFEPGMLVLNIIGE